MQQLKELDTAALINLLAHLSDELDNMTTRSTTHEDYITQLHLVKMIQKEINIRTDCFHYPVQGDHIRSIHIK